MGRVGAGRDIKRTNKLKFNCKSEPTDMSCTDSSHMWLLTVKCGKSELRRSVLNPRFQRLISKSGKHVTHNLYTNMTLK